MVLIKTSNVYSTLLALLVAAGVYVFSIKWFPVQAWNWLI